jgi:7,8-dihydropterin-6-yl-methyl-4-(beta-D-ribofuranosyl)aminobenzene 5'-phosphate synthase
VIGQDRTIELVSMSRQTMPSVEKLKVTILAEDSVTMEKPDLVAKHGLSFLIETSFAGTDSRILADAGPPPDIALQNADIMGVSLQKVDGIFISHGHYDHAGGLLGILKSINKPIPVLAHPRIFSPKFAHKPNLKYIGLGYDPSSVTNTGGALILARNPVKIMDGVTTSGEVARETIYEKAEGLWTVENECFMQDAVIDDQALIVNVSSKGLVVVTGCAHSGIINTLRHAQKMTGINKVCAVVGGFHLDKADDERIVASIDELVKINPAAIYPCHCTGSKATRRLLDSFGDRCKPVQTGDVIQI